MTVGITGACGSGTVDDSTSTSGSVEREDQSLANEPSTTMRMAIGSEPTTLDPHIADDGGERAVNDNVYEALTRREPDGTLVPGLAVELPTQVDELTWRVTLRGGITFHDGTMLDSSDVVATIDRVLALAGDSAQFGSFYSTLAGADIVDESTVEITTTAPDPILPARLYWMKIIPEGADARPDYAEHPVGTGPYRFVAWERGQAVRLSANTDYWGPSPAIADVDLRFVPEYGSRLAGLLAGEYDLITNLAPEDVEQAPQSASIGGLEHPVITLDADEGITADARVRQALNHAIDRHELSDALFLGFAEVDRGQAIADTHFGFDSSIEPYPYDPELAKELLDAAGVTGSTIQLLGTSGRWLRDAETMQAVAGYWEAVGLEVDLQILEFGSWLAAWSDRDVRPDAVYLNSSNELFDADRTLTALYHPDGIGSSNSDRELGALIDEARHEVDEQRREALYHDAFRRAHEQAYQVPLLRVLDSYGLSERLEWTPRADAKLIVHEMAFR